MLQVTFWILVNEASRNALKERSRIKQEYLEAAIKTNPPSISDKQLKKYETFRNFATTEIQLNKK